MKNIIFALDLAQAELLAMYKRTGIKGSNVLDIVESAWREAKNISSNLPVSPNEANPISENKKDGEVAVLPADSYSETQILNILTRYTKYVYDNRNNMGGLSVYYPFAKDWFNKNIKAGKTGG